MAKFKDFNEFANFIYKIYGVKAEFPWQEYPEFAVFRHDNKKAKWFCLFMRISGEKFGLKDKILSVINLKCDPELAQILHDDKGIFPAYHMNKKHWISVVLSVIPKSQVVDLIKESYKLSR